MSGLIRLREELHYRILISRSMETILLRPKFERLWEDSTDKEKEEAKKLITEHNKSGLLKWMKEHPSIDISEKSVRDLIPIARRLGVKN